MRRTGDTPEQIVNKMREADTMPAAGRAVAQVVRALGVSEQTFGRWPGTAPSLRASTTSRPATPNPTRRRAWARRQHLRQQNRPIARAQARPHPNSPGENTLRIRALWHRLAFGVTRWKAGKWAQQDSNL